MGHLYRPLGGPRPQATLTDLHLITASEPSGAPREGGEAGRGTGSPQPLPLEIPWPQSTTRSKDPRPNAHVGSEGTARQMLLEPCLVAKGAGKVQEATVAGAMPAELRGGNGSGDSRATMRPRDSNLVTGDSSMTRGQAGTANCFRDQGPCIKASRALSLWRT